MLLDSPIQEPPATNARIPGAKSASLPAKVLCFVPNLGNGGAEMHLLRLLNHFDRTQIQPLLAVARKGGSYESRLPSDVSVQLCGWPSLPSSTLRTQAAVPGLRRLICREKPAIVLTFLEHAVAATAQALKRLPHPRPLFIAGIQNNLEKTLEHLPRWTRGWLRRDILSAYAQTDHVIALSHGVAESLLELVPALAGRVSVVHNAGYDQEVEHLALEEPSLPMPCGPLFLGCGRLTEQKDFHTLLLAFDRIKNEVSGELWILGEGPLRPKLEREIAALGLSERVRLPGFVKNPFAFMARASTFVLSSRWEGFGNVITEAMACGTPVISTDCPHGPREILEAGHWGDLVPVGDVAALANAMRRSIRDSAQARVRADQARDHVKQFEAATITRKYEAAVLAALSARHKLQSP